VPTMVRDWHDTGLLARKRSQMFPSSTTVQRPLMSWTNGRGVTWPPGVSVVPVGKRRRDGRIRCHRSALKVLRLTRPSRRHR
jgi:hypothetical protein